MFARTERLLLRPGWLDDAPALAKAIGEERIVRNLATAPWPYRRRDAEVHLAREDAILPNFLIFARTERPPELVGAIGFGSTHEGVELGYWIASGCWNRGYATEAGHAALAVARDALRLRVIVAGHFADNPASGRVLEKLGFAATGETGVRHNLARREHVEFTAFKLELSTAGSRHERELISA